MVKVIIDTRAINAQLDNMDQKFKDRVALIAVESAAKKTAKIVKASAVAAGLSGGQDKSKNGWDWTTVGSIVRSVRVSKKWTRTKTVVGKKVFNTSSRKYLLSERAPHAHLIIQGHRKYIPTGIPGKGQVRPAKNFMSRSRNIYSAAMLSASGLLHAESVRALNNAVRRINRSRGKL